VNGGITSPEAFGTDLLLRARAALSAGDLDSSRLLAAVCNMPGVPAAAAREIAATLLGASPWFEHRADGTWSLSDVLRRAEAGVQSGVRLDSLAYVVVDVETTGLSPQRNDRITEIAAYHVDGRSITEAYSTLVNPGRPIPRYITSLTGISWRMVKDLPSFASHAAAIDAALRDRVFVAHNARFDWRFVSSEMARCAGRPLRMDLLCTVKMARTLLPDLPRRSLDYVAGHLGIEIESRHRAAGDARATAEVLSRLIGVAAEQGVETWGQLQELLIRRGSTPGGAGAARRRRRRRWYP
jgi:DNA polymerase-3 subunit epsilon